MDVILPFYLIFKILFEFRNSNGAIQTSIQTETVKTHNRGTTNAIK